MPTLRLPQLSAAPVLMAIDRDRLLRFLGNYRGFFVSRNIDLPSPGFDAPIPYDDLIAVFMSPDETTPKELVDALFYIDGMATAEGMHALLAVCRKLELKIGEATDFSPADVAVQVWILAPDQLERAHAEQYQPNPRSFEYFQTDETPPPPAPTPSCEVLKRLEDQLNNWFAANRRGRTARVFAFARPDAAWFLIRHGEPFKREQTADGVEPGSVAYRPLRYDVVAYDPNCGELRINAQLKGLKDLYREAFGHHLFGRHDFFSDGVKYTLEPLREIGEGALRTLDVPGLEWARLHEIHLSWGGAQGEYEIIRANDVFAAFRDRGNRALPKTPQLARAVFQVKLLDSLRPRMVTIRPPRIALYTRDQDAATVEEWLQKRGFLNVYPADNEATDPILAYS